MQKERLLQLGNEAASIWGGSCYDYEIDQKGKEVVFYCIEHGENFSTSMSFFELKSCHGMDLDLSELTTGGAI